jgi:hypothetical protein
LYTDIRWQGAADALAGEAIRVNQNFFQVTGNTAGPNCVISVQVLSEPELAPTPGPCSLSFSRGRGYWRDYGKTGNWQQRLHFEPVQDMPVVTAGVLAVSDLTEENTGVVYRTVTLDQSLTDPQGVLLPGALLCGGIVYPVFAHTLGDALQLQIALLPSPGNSALLIGPGPGAACIYYPGRRYEVYLPGFELEIPTGQAITQAQVAVSTSDGKAYILDDPIWSRPGRGGLGGRTGNESALSPAFTVQAVLRQQPPGLNNVPPVPDEPIYAHPANYYGQAHYTLVWDAVPGVAGYAVYRCSGATLLALSGSPGARYSDVELQVMASLESSQPAFRRLNTDTVTETSYEDSFDGRGQGVYLYRVRTVDAAGNQSEWSPAFPPVHIYDVTPPATPVVTSVTGGENRVILKWRANREKDLSKYLVWRDLDANALADVRRIPASVTVSPGSEPTMTLIDEGLVGLRTYYYRIAAVDTNGNVSLPTALIAARTIDTKPPNAPTWTNIAWITDADGKAVQLAWQIDESGLTCTVQRRPLGGGIWIAVSDELGATAPPYDFEFLDRSADPGVAYEYRLLAKDLAGNKSIAFILAQTWPEE